MRRQVELARCRIDLVRAAVQEALRDVRSRHAGRTSASIRLLALGVTPGIALTALLAAVPGEVFATDITRSSQSTSFWSDPASWSGGVSPGAADRAIFGSTAGFSLRVDQPRTDVGQLLYTGAPAGANFINFASPSAAVLFIHGIGGVGVDIQSNYTATLYNAVGIAADQTWQAGNASGGGFITGGIGTGLVDLGSSTLTLNLVNAVNTGQLVRLIGAGNVVKTGLGKLTLTGASTFTGSTNINAGTLALSGSGAIATSSGLTLNNGSTFDISATSAGSSIRTLAGGGNVAVGAKTLTITAGNDTFSGILSGTSGRLTVSGGTEILTGANTYTGGTTIAAGATLQLGNGGASGSIVGNVANNGALTLSHPGNTYTFGGDISGAGTVNLSAPSASTTTFTGTNTYTGATTLTNAVLQLGNGGTTGSIVGNVAFNNGSLNINRSDTYSFGGLISGSGTVTQVGTGTTVLSGDNTYTGATDITAGTLRINGNQSAATGLVTVASGATLGGSGIIGGAVTVANGGHIAPGNSPGTLTMGSLTLIAGSVLDFELGQASTVGGALNDLINVNGNLTLDGTLNVSASVGGTYGAGIYRLINYTGTLIDNGLSFGLMPAGSTNILDTAIAHQINLVNTQGLTLNYWDGATDGRNNGQIGGGDGIWQAAGNDNWATGDGSLNAPYQSAAMPIFGGAAGTVTVDDHLGNVTVSGLQFATSGYLIQGDAVTLGAGVNVVRVGDGSGAGAAYTATIASALTGAGTLDKQDLGTLVLTGANTYTGGTVISTGILQLGNGGTSGSLVGDITNNATLAFNRSDVLTLAGAISGNGEVRQVGSGTTTLTAVGSTAGAVTVAAGTLEVASGAGLATNTTTVAAEATLSNSGTLTGTSGDDTFTLGGTFIGTAGLLGGNDYVQILDGANISQASFDGGAGTDTMDVTTDSSLTLPPTLATGFENLIKHGTGTVTLSGTVDSFSDSIEVATGTLALSAATVQTSLVRIDQGATLTGTGSLSGNLSNSGVFSFASTPGTLNVGGAYVQTGTGTLISHIRPGGTDLLNVAGSATLAGTHQIQIEYGLYLNGTTHTVLQAAGGISGDYDSVQINPSALMSATRQLTANAETLTFLRQPITSITDPQSGKGRFAQWLEDNISGDALTPKMSAYIDELLQQPTASGVEGLLGERSAPPPTVAVAQNDVSILGVGFAHSIFERFQLTDQAECIEMQTASNEAPQCFWAHGLRQWGHANGDQSGPRTDWTTDGLQVGVDRSLSESWKAGISFGFADSEIHDPTGGSNDLRARMVGVYTQYEAGPLGIGALGFYSDNDNSTRRTVDVDNNSRQAMADFATNSYGIGTRLGYRLAGASGPSLRPFIEAFYNHLQGAHFGEGNAGAGDLTGNILDREDLRGSVGVQLAESFETNRLVFRPMIELGASHEFRDVRSTVDLQPFNDSAIFRTSGPALDRNSYLARASLDVAVAKNAAITLGYGGEFADSYSQHQGSVSFRVAW